MTGLAMVEYLIGLGASLEVENEVGCTPAAMFSFPYTVKPEHKRLAALLGVPASKYPADVSKLPTDPKRTGECLLRSSSA